MLWLFELLAFRIRHLDSTVLLCRVIKCFLSGLHVGLTIITLIFIHCLLLQLALMQLPLPFFFVYPIVQFSFLRQQQWGQMWCFKKTSSALKAMEQYGKRIHLSCLENCSWTSCCLRDLVADATTPTATTLNPITPLTFAQNSEAQESHNRTGCLNGAKDIISTTATAIKLMPTCCPKHVSSGLNAMIKLHLY